MANAARQFKEGQERAFVKASLQGKKILQVKNT